MDGVTVAKIALSAAVYAIDKPYDYTVPPELTQVLRPGMRVLVPFGAGNRRTEGLVLALEPDRPPDARRKPVAALLDEEPVLDAKALRLALWMRERWFCTVYDAARAMLPAGLYFSLQDRWKLAPGTDRETAFEAAGRSEQARRLLELLFASGGQADVMQIREAFGTKDPNPALKLLRDKGILVLETSASRGVKDKMEQVASLALPPEEALAQMEPRRRTAPLQYAVVELLCGLGCASAKELCYFTGASGATLRTLEKRGLLILEKRRSCAGPRCRRGWSRRRNRSSMQSSRQPTTGWKIWLEAAGPRRPCSTGSPAAARPRSISSSSAGSWSGAGPPWSWCRRSP